MPHRKPKGYYEELREEELREREFADYLEQLNRRAIPYATATIRWGPSLSKAAVVDDLLEGKPAVSACRSLAIPHYPLLYPPHTIPYPPPSGNPPAFNYLWSAAGAGVRFGRASIPRALPG